MGNAIHAGKSGQIISRRVLHKAAVLSSHEEAMRENEIGSAAIDESGAPLRAGPHQILRVENQRRQNERRESPYRHADHIRLRRGGEPYDPRD
jgi:hypothetical protein